MMPRCASRPTEQTRRTRGLNSVQKGIIKKVTARFRRSKDKKIVQEEKREMEKTDAGIE